MNGRPSCCSTSWTVQMFGWLSEEASFASRSKRASAAASADSRGGRNLSATSRSSSRSCARYTTPMPPAPSSCVDAVARDGLADHRGRLERRPRRRTSRSMPEVAHAGEDHRQAVLVGGRDHLLVAHRAARLDDRDGAGRARSRRSPSRNGKNASEATTLPASGSTAFCAAIRAESTRLIWPAPTPTVCCAFANTIAFDLTCFADGPRQQQRPPLLVGRLALW